MLSFVNDYSEGCHPRILARLAETNLLPQSGYGEDAYCQRAKERIRALCETPAAEVCFLSGGTQTNRIALSALLRPWEGVLAAETGHIVVHEAGAIEAGGHKVLTLPAHAGKLDPAELAQALETFHADANRAHMVQPGLLYLSFPTELGTLYTKAELQALRAICDRYHIPMYLDGARLGCGLVSPDCDLTLPELAALCDAFYLGGTKQGAMLGEALVFPQGAPPHFVTLVKQHGGLLAKGRLLGLQFDALLEDGLYFDLARNALERAGELRAVFREKGYRFYLESPTNQQFLLLDRETQAKLDGKVAFSFWERYDAGRDVVRFCTSWATTPEQIEALRALLPDQKND